MRTKKKLAVSIGSLVVASGAAVGLTFGVLAATNQAIRNEFSVNYVANNVSAIVSANYATKLGTTGNFTDTNGNTEIEFEPGDDSSTQILSVEQINLTASDNYVIFTYRYTNTATAANGAHWLAVEFLNDSISRENLTTTYYCSSSNAETYSNIKTNGYSTFNSIPQKTVYIEPQGSFYFYTLEEITDVTHDAGFSATSNDIGWGLSTVARSSVPQAWFTYVESMLGTWAGTEQEDAISATAQLSLYQSEGTDVSLEAQFKTPSMQSAASLTKTTNSNLTSIGPEETLKTTTDDYYSTFNDDGYTIFGYKITNNEVGNYISYRLNASEESTENTTGHFTISTKTSDSNTFSFIDSAFEYNQMVSGILAPGETVVVYVKVSRYEDSDYASLVYEYSLPITVQIEEIPDHSQTSFNAQNQTGYEHKFASASVSYQIANQNAVAFTNNEATTIDFYDDGDESSQIANLNLSGNNVFLTKTAPYVVYKIAVKNENISGGYWLNIAYNRFASTYAEAENVEIYYANSSSDSLSVNQIIALDDDDMNIITLSLAGQETHYFYEVIKLSDDFVSAMSNDEVGAICCINPNGGAAMSLYQSLQKYYGVSIEYQHGTSATLSATYLEESDGVTRDFVNYQGQTTAIFTTGSSSTNAYLSAPGINLNGNEYLLFKYRVTNSSPMQISAVFDLPNGIASYETSASHDSFRQYYLISASDNLGYAQVLSSATQESRVQVSDHYISSFKNFEMTVPSGATRYLYVIVENLLEEDFDYLYDISTGIIEIVNSYSSVLKLSAQNASVTVSAVRSTENGTTENFVKNSDTSVTFTINQSMVHDYLYLSPVTLNTTDNSYALYKITLVNNYGVGMLAAIYHHFDSAIQNLSGLNIYRLASSESNLTASDVKNSGTFTASNTDYIDNVQLAANETKYYYMVVDNVGSSEKTYSTKQIDIVMQSYGNGSEENNEDEPEYVEREYEFTYDSQENEFSVTFGGTTYTTDSLSETVTIGTQYQVKAYINVGGDDYEVTYYENQGYGIELGGEAYTDPNCNFGDLAASVGGGSYDITYKLVVSQGNEVPITYSNQNENFSVTIDGKTYTLASLSETVTLGTEYEVRAYITVNDEEYQVSYIEAQSAYGIELNGTAYTDPNCHFGDLTATVAGDSYDIIYKLVVITLVEPEFVEKEITITYDNQDEEFSVTLDGTTYTMETLSETVTLGPQYEVKAYINAMGQDFEVTYFEEQGYGIEIYGTPYVDPNCEFGDLTATVNGDSYDITYKLVVSEGNEVTITYDNQNSNFSVTVDGTTYTFESLSETVTLGTEYEVRAYISALGGKYRVNYYENQGYGVEVAGDVYIAENCEFGDLTATVAGQSYDIIYKLVVLVPVDAPVERNYVEEEVAITYDSQNEQFSLELNGDTYNIASLSDTVTISTDYDVVASFEVDGEKLEIVYLDEQNAYGVNDNGTISYDSNFNFGDSTIDYGDGDMFDVDYTLSYTVNNKTFEEAIDVISIGTKVADITYDDQNEQFEVIVGGTTYALQNLSEITTINNQQYAVKAFVDLEGSNGIDFSAGIALRTVIELEYSDYYGKYVINFKSVFYDNGNVTSVSGTYTDFNEFTFGDLVIGIGSGEDYQECDVIYKLYTANSTTSFRSVINGSITSINSLSETVTVSQQYAVRAYIVVGQDEYLVTYYENQGYGIELGGEVYIADNCEFGDLTASVGGESYDIVYKLVVITPEDEVVQNQA